MAKTTVFTDDETGAEAIGLNHEFREIDPKLAEEWLGVNTSNYRPLSSRRVETYAKDMREGLWHVNGAPITFDKYGKLADGQHRLQAVISSGATIQSAVLWGVEPRAIDVMDRGRPRQVSDVLRRKGYKSVTNLGAALGLLVKYEQGTLGSNEAIRVESALNTLERHPTLPEAVSAANKVWMRSKLFPAVAAVAFYLTSQISPEDADVFWDAVASPEHLGADDPAYRLHFQMRENFTSKQRISAKKQLALALKGWNKFRNGEKIKVLTWNATEPFPTPR